MLEIKNAAQIESEYAGYDTYAESSVTVQRLAIKFEKTADPMHWISGDLTYTVTLTNDEGLPLTNPVFQDTLDTNTTYVAGSAEVTINGTITPVTPSFTGGVLTIDLPEIPAAATVVITFRVSYTGP